MDKPEFLYHGSPTTDLETLTPKERHYRDLHEGPLIFATADIGLASIFMSGPVDSEIGYFNDNFLYVLFDISKEEFLEKDKGGCVYVLPSESFTTTTDKGMGQHEWTSRENVIPAKVIKFNSVLDAMLENRVQVYFIDIPTMEKIRASDDYGFSLIKDLRSENLERNVNPQTL